MSRRIRRVKELEELDLEGVAGAGGRLLLLSADVAEPESMDRAWAAVEERFGAVQGVIHAAGLPGGDRIAAQTVESAGAVMRPKVKGSEVLAGLVAGKGVDFLLFCSSINSVAPGVGAAAYTAANGFQDRYATWCRQHLGLPAYAINFDAWQEVGMAAEMVLAAEFEPEKQERLRAGMSPEEGLDVIERILVSDQVQVLVSTREISEIFREVALAQLAGSGRGKDELHGLADDSARLGETEVTPETLAVMAFWRELLGADSIEPGDNFFELGGHSLLGTMVLARIREQFGVDLSIRAIFEAPTPESLGSRIRQTERIEPVPESVAAGGEREEFEI
jgi:NADP-dependent 3-hydroxy acid dehydrogenase YdfG